MKYLRLINKSLFKGLKLRQLVQTALNFLIIPRLGIKSYFEQYKYRDIDNCPVLDDLFQTLTNLSWVEQVGSEIKSKDDLKIFSIENDLRVDCGDISIHFSRKADIVRVVEKFDDGRCYEDYYDSWYFNELSGVSITLSKNPSRLKNLDQIKYDLIIQIITDKSLQTLKRKISIGDGRLKIELINI